MLRNLELMGAAPAAGEACFCISTAPVAVITERLVLRPFELDDFAAFEELMADPEAFRHSDRGPLSSDEAWTRFLRQAGHWALLGYGLFAVTDRASGAFLGEVGFGDFHRELGPEFDGHPEASWTIADWARGNGVASEAAAAALAWLEQSRGLERTVCLIQIDNHASIRIANKLGYRQYDEIRYRGYRALTFERPATGANA